MMNKILTISIAAYNIEKYVNETLDSFVIPEVMDDIEIILVNDGSKDGTGKLARSYESEYPNTFIIVDKENGGYGSTINTSVEIASGKYFKTVDGDDWVDRQGFIKLVEYLKRAETDIVVTNYSRVNDKTGKQIPTVFKIRRYETAFDFSEAYTGQELYMQSIAFKTDILKRIDFHITEHCFYTDIEYILRPMPYIKTISYLNQNVYMYRVAVNEQSMSVKGKRKHIDEQLLILKKMCGYYAKHSELMEDGKKKFFDVILSGMLKSHVTAILSLRVSTNAKKRLLEIERTVKKECPSVFKEAYRYKTLTALRRTNYALYSMGSISYKIYQGLLSLTGR